MLVHSQMLGTVDVLEETIITMARPIYGFEHLREFCLIDWPDSEPIRWLQSIEDQDVIFAVINPAVVLPDYRVEINAAEVHEIELHSPESVETLVIITADSNSGMTVNLQAPLIINTENGLAKQQVLVNSKYRVQEKIDFSDIEQISTEKEHSYEAVGV